MCSLICGRDLIYGKVKSKVSDTRRKSHEKTKQHVYLVYISRFINKCVQQQRGKVSYHEVPLEQKK